MLGYVAPSLLVSVYLVRVPDKSVPFNKLDCAQNDPILITKRGNPASPQPPPPFRNETAEPAVQRRKLIHEVQVADRYQESLGTSSLLKLGPYVLYLATSSIFPYECSYRDVEMPCLSSTERPRTTNLVSRKSQMIRVKIVWINIKCVRSSAPGSFVRHFRLAGSAVAAS